MVEGFQAQSHVSEFCFRKIVQAEVWRVDCRSTGMTSGTLAGRL